MMNKENGKWDLNFLIGTPNSRLREREENDHLRNHILPPRYDENLTSSRDMFMRGPIELVYFGSIKPNPRIEREDTFEDSFFETSGEFVDKLDKFAESTMKFFKRIGTFIVRKIYKDKLITDGKNSNAEENNKNSSTGKDFKDYYNQKNWPRQGENSKTVGDGSDTKSPNNKGSLNSGNGERVD